MSESKSEEEKISLYDPDIKALIQWLEAQNPRKLWADQPWNCTKQETLVLRGDMAYELGGSGKPAVSGLCFTTDETLVPSGGTFLIGPDLPEIREDPGYARITMLRLDPKIPRGEGEMESQRRYHQFREMDYTRYHLYPEGYMMRISAVKEREPVRIAKRALQAGIGFANVGKAFEKAYLEKPWVKAVRIYFVTDPGADFRLLGDYAHRFETITESMNRIFQGLRMDCNTCEQRRVCDLIDGMKEMHGRNMIGG